MRGRRRRRCCSRTCPATPRACGSSPARPIPRSGWRSRMGLPVPSCPLDVVRAYRDRMQSTGRSRPRRSRTGAVFENVDRDDDGRSQQIPGAVPAREGRRPLSSAPTTSSSCAIRTADWINAATYRCMVHDKNHVAIWMSPGKQGRQIRDKYFSAGQAVPGADLLRPRPAAVPRRRQRDSRYGLSEYDYAGGHRGEPYEVVPSELHGLPMPAHAEIVLEGEMVEAHDAQGRPVRRVHRLLRVVAEQQPLVHVEARLSPQRSDPLDRLADAAAVGLLVLEMRDEGRHDLGRGRARGPLGRQPACGCTSSAARACST